jgi:hypothetical protein
MVGSSGPAQTIGLKNHGEFFIEGLLKRRGPASLQLLAAQFVECVPLLNDNRFE